MTNTRTITQREYSDSWAYDLSNNVVDKGEIFDVDVINQSIENILMTLIGERIFNISFGSNLMLRVFELASAQKGEQLLNDVSQTIKRWDDRIDIIDSEMKLEIDVDNNSAVIDIPYRIRNTGIKSRFKKKIINY